jgi:hypothetical protein
MGQTFIADRYCVLCREAEELAIKSAVKERRGKVEVTAVVKEVGRKQVTPKSGANPFTLFEITAGDHTWVTKIQDIALTAHSLVGKNVIIDGKVEQNGNYTNYYINSIKEADDSTSVIAPTTVEIPLSTTSNGKSPEEEAKIHRQVATKVAALLADTPIDFWQNVDSLMTFYSTGNHPYQGDTNGESTTQATQFQGDDGIPF